MRGISKILLATSLMIILVISAFATGCSSSENVVTEGGSTTIQPLAELLAEAYMEKHPDIKVDIKGGGSSVGINSAMNGLVDIGAVSRELTEKEQNMGLNVYILAKDGIAIAVHPTQNISDISVENVRDIFAGKITNWSEVGGEDREIHVVAREEGSGTRAAFEDMIMDLDNGGPVIMSSAILQSSNGAVRTTIAGDPDAIGFISFGYLDSSIKALSVNGVEGNVHTALDGTYPVVRPLLFVTRGEPNELAKSFIDFCLGSEGQEIVGQEYIPVYGK
jgi:phosphate transport system substrate-binding protein